MLFYKNFFQTSLFFCSLYFSSNFWSFAKDLVSYAENNARNGSMEHARKTWSLMITNTLVKLIEMHASFNNISINVNATLTTHGDNLVVTNKSASPQLGLQAARNDYRRYLIN